MTMMRRCDRKKSTIFLTRLLVVLMICTVCLPLQTQTASAASKPKAATLTSVSQSGKKLTVKWQTVEGCTGYQVQYADNRLFLGKTSVKINDPAASSKQFTGLSATDVYYARVRAFTTDADGTAYSAWDLSDNVKVNKTITRTPLYSVPLLKKKFEIRKAAGQKIPGYDTVQGICYGGGYAYFCLENRTIASSKARCKIVKVKLSDLKVVKVSKALKLSHGNDMTYDTKRDRIVVAHSTPVPKKVSIVNPSTLKVTATKTVSLPNTIEGIKDSTLKKYKNGSYNGFGAIAYNEKHDKFVVCLRGQKFHHLMILNSDFKPVVFHWLDRSKGEMAMQMLQGMDSYDDFIMVGQSYGYGYKANNILVYNWDGDLLSKLDMGTTYELESLFHAKGNFYCAYYTSYYKNSKLQRDNFIYQLTDL